MDGELPTSVWGSWLRNERFVRGKYGCKPNVPIVITGTFRWQYQENEHNWYDNSTFDLGEVYTPTKPYVELWMYTSSRETSGVTYELTLTAVIDGQRFSKSKDKNSIEGTILVGQSN